MSKVRVPFLVVNPKSYLYGEESLKLAKAADAAAKETGVEVLFTCPFADIRYIKENTENVIVTAQHMESLRPGRGMGHVLPESLKAAGAEAVFLNHAENPLTVAELSACIKRARELEMATVVCADSVLEGTAVAKFSPDIILCEPTDLIGTGTVAGDDYVLEATQKINAIDPDVLVMIASGVSTADDVYNVIKLGADGTGATSGIVNAPDPGQRVMEMAKAMVQAMKDREEK
ncbi:MAG: triose-phosphate isomerase [Eubacteriales bacterium]|nr:triose-phosphate isomerase [Eubacteriales bacterium]